MAFQARHRWIMQKVNDLLEIRNEEYVEESMTGLDNFKILNTFFKANGPEVIFFYYQPRDILDEDGNLVSGDGGKTLFITTGTAEALRSKAVYFSKPGLLPGESRRELDTTIASDGKLSYGTVDADALKSMESVINVLLRPSLENYKSEDWKDATTAQSSEFLTKTENFVNNIQEALKSLNTGLELQKPDRKYKIDPKNIPELASNLDIVHHFIELLNDWCTQTENYLDDSDQVRYESSDIGPASELDYWRRRLQRLTSITEQLKTKECKVVLMTLTAVTKLSTESGVMAKQQIIGLMRRWKQVDMDITEATNKAKDNVKYLATLEKFIEPLYSGNPESIRETLPSLLNGIKMIYTIARYYNTTETMTMLFMKITNQMITTCKSSIIGNEASDAIWSMDTDSLLRNLQSCLKLNEAYQEQYRLTKDRLLTMPKGKQFEFSEVQIFGKFDLFCRRIIRMIDLFSTIQQFVSLTHHNLEGMGPLLKRFTSIVEDFKTKKHDLLDYHSNIFDRDYVEFKIHIADLEDSLQQYINQSFESITSIEHSLQLLKKFQKILQRESLRDDLESKFTIIFHNYGSRAAASCHTV